MKKIIQSLVLLVLLIKTPTQAQEQKPVVPLGTIEDMMAFRDLHDLRGKDCDILDTNNVLGKYEGTWQGIKDGKEYTVLFSKKSTWSYGNAYKKDVLIMRHRVKNIETNEILFDSFQDPEEDLAKGSLYYKRKYPVDLKYKNDPYFYQLRFAGDKLSCEDDFGRINIGFNNENLLELKFFLKERMFETSGCPEGYVFEPNQILYLSKVVTQ